MESSTEFQDWELLHPNSAVVNSPDDNNINTDFHGIEAESQGMIRSDYFSLHNQRTYAKSVALSEEDASTESDNPSWIDPASETRLYPRKNSAESWSDSTSDRSDDRKFTDFEAKNEVGFEKGDQFSEVDVKIELRFTGNEKSELGFAGLDEISAKGKNLSEFWSDSGGDGLVAMKFADMGKKSELGMGFDDHVKTSGESGEKEGGEGSVTEFGAGDVHSSAAEEAKPKGLWNGEEESKKSIVWWKVPLEVMKYCLFKVSPVWTFSMAAAVMGIVILGRRLYKMKRKTRGLELKLAVDDKKVSQFMTRAARLNEAFSVVRRVPIVRPALPAPVVNAWPVMSLR